MWPWVFQSEYAPRLSPGEMAGARLGLETLKPKFEPEFRLRLPADAGDRGLHAPSRPCPAETSMLWVMSAELIAILAVGVALGGVLVTSLRGISYRLGKVAERLGGVEQRVARLEGQFEGSGLFRPAAAAESAAGD